MYSVILYIWEYITQHFKWVNRFQKPLFLQPGIRIFTFFFFQRFFPISLSRATNIFSIDLSRFFTSKRLNAFEKKSCQLTIEPERRSFYFGYLYFLFSIASTKNFSLLKKLYAHLRIYALPLIPIFIFIWSYSVVVKNVSMCSHWNMKLHSCECNLLHSCLLNRSLKEF